MKAASKSIPLDWAYSPNLDVSKEDAERQWDLFWMRRREEVNSWILRWIDGESVVESDSELRFLVAARFQAVTLLCGLLVFSNSGRILSLFPYPEGEESDVLCGLLIDWCIGKGMFMLFDQGWINKMIVG
jgi:hypothetical protein